MPETDPHRRRLWTGPQDHGHDHDWLSPDPEPTRVQEPAPYPLRRPPSRKRPVAIVAGALVLAIGGIGAGMVLENGGVGNERATVTLPVVNGATAETRAGQIYRATEEGIVQLRTGNASGTGFIVDKNGTIVTNAHVVDSATTVRVVFDDGEKSVEGKVLGRDVSTDLAVVKVAPSDLPQSAVALALADSDDVKAGDEVIAVGYPLGLDRTVTQGIISGLGRQIQAQNGFSIDKVLQTDASINPGNSGGPLLDAKGRVIGVNSQIAATAAGGNTGIGFAIPSNTVREIVPKLVAGKSIARPYLGVSLAETDDDSGAIVADATAGGPGATAGLKTGTNGDKIVSFEGKAISSPDELISALGTKEVGDTVKLGVIRDGQQIEVEVTLGERPASADTSSSSSGSGGGSQSPQSPDSGGGSQSPDSGSGQTPDQQTPQTPDEQQSPFEQIP